MKILVKGEAISPNITISPILNFMPRHTSYCLLLLCFCYHSNGFAEEINIDKLFKHYKYLHQNPELSLQEKNTSAYLAQQLKAMGYQVESGIGGYGLVAMLKNGDGPTILYRTDMDALPIEEKTGLEYSSAATAVNRAGESVAVMHACGHDIHMTVMLGIAEQMQHDKDKWQGTLLLIAEPAEEIGAGSKAMLADGLYRRFPLPDYILGFHVSPDIPAGQIGYVSGYSMANVDSVDITIYGVGGHGAYPQKTKDPIVIAAQTVLALQTIVSRELSPLDSAVVTVGSIHGGTKHNIIPDQVRLQLTVRSYADETRNFLLRRIKEISRGIARAAAIPEENLPSVTFKDEYTPSVYNNPKFVSKIVPMLKKALGDAAINTVDPVMAGEDFSRYGRTKENIPSALLWLGAVNKNEFQAAKKNNNSLPGLHSAYFAPDAEPTVATGVKVMSMLMFELFSEK